MKLKKIIIRNLRGLQNIHFDMDSLTSLIGKNNCGKSSILRAIELVCTGVKPDLEEFYLRQHEQSIEIEAVFNDIKDWERNNPSISGLIHNNELHLRYKCCVALDGDKKKCEVEYHAYKREDAVTGWSETFAELTAEIQEIARSIAIANQTVFKTKANKEKLKQKLRDEYSHLIEEGELQWTNESISFNNALQQAIPKVILIPAVKDAIEEMKFFQNRKVRIRRVDEKAYSACYSRPRRVYEYSESN